MEELGTGFADLARYIVWPYMAIFVLLSYMIKKTFGDFLQNHTKFEWQPVYTVLILATIIGIAWVLFTDDTVAQVAVTYAIGTTFHETIFQFFVKKITGK